MGFLAAGAMVALMAAGCQKDRVVTFVAETPEPCCIGDGGDTVGYFCGWSDGDMVYVNDVALPVTVVAGAEAKIANVPQSDAYRAVYPAQYVTSSHSIGASGRVSVSLPWVRHYEEVDGRQRVNAVMGAYATGGDTLHFHRLCGVVRVTVNNQMDTSIAIEQIRLTSAKSALSGMGEAVINGDEADSIVLFGTPPSQSRELVLAMPSGVPVVVKAHGSRSFDIEVPGIAKGALSVKVYTTDGYFKMMANDVEVRNKSVGTITANVTGLTEYRAVLVDGWLFNRNLPDIVTSVRFEYNCSRVTGTVLSTDASDYTVCGKMEGNTWVVYTSAEAIYANPDCAKMFCGKKNLRSIDFGGGFITSGTSDMSSMFEGCGNLVSLNLSNFDMRCANDTKSHMCSGLSTLSGHCTIICTESTQAALEEGTDLPTTGVLFTWVRPPAR